MRAAIYRSPNHDYTARVLIEKSGPLDKRNLCKRLGRREERAEPYRKSGIEKYEREIANNEVEAVKRWWNEARRINPETRDKSRRNIEGSNILDIYPSKP